MLKVACSHGGLRSGSEALPRRGARCAEERAAPERTAAKRVTPPHAAAEHAATEHAATERTAAEREGFEPPVRFRTPDFESGTFGHSVISPRRKLAASTERVKSRTAHRSTLDVIVRRFLGDDDIVHVALA